MVPFQTRLLTVHANMIYDVDNNIGNYILPKIYANGLIA